MPDYNADDIYLLYNMINKPVLKENVNKLITKGGECKIFCVNEKIHTKKEVASVE